MKSPGRGTVAQAKSPRDNNSRSSERRNADPSKRVIGDDPLGWRCARLDNGGDGYLDDLIVWLALPGPGRRHVELPLADIDRVDEHLVNATPGAKDIVE